MGEEGDNINANTVDIRMIPHCDGKRRVFFFFLTNPLTGRRSVLKNERTVCTNSHEPLPFEEFPAKTMSRHLEVKENQKQTEYEQYCHHIIIITIIILFCSSSSPLLSSSFHSASYHYHCHLSNPVFFPSFFFSFPSFFCFIR